MSNLTNVRSLTTLLRSRWQQFQPSSAVAPENSLLFRVLVQALVTVGIIATDVAAADAVGVLGISVWAIPVSAVGATWSWYNRHKRNIPVKFCIAIAMLVALAAFFVRLLGTPNDTRLALAELLIQLQVFHSFDLPRRKDLGYSMMIGLILIGVSATLSQTLVFAPWLLLFLAIALPCLILDYRSRLGLASPFRLRRVGADLSLKRLGLFLLITLGLGLVIFACLPRLPGYQLRTFPISAPIETAEDFDGRTIINPGYVNEGRGRADSGSDGNRDTGPGELDDTNYYGFSSRMNQNLRGELTPRVVMRVRSQAAGFWRVLGFDRYTGQGWEISRNASSDLDTIRRTNWSYRFYLPWNLPPWLVERRQTKEIVQSYTIVADLPNLVPSLYEPKQLFFPMQEIAVDKEGGMRAPLGLVEGLTYTVISDVPYRDRTQLRQTSTDYPDSIRDYYLQIPNAIAPQIRAKTEDILAASPNPITTPSEKALYLAQYLKQNYTIQPDLPYLGRDDDLVEAFLFTYEGGYPDHFSTTLTMMLRSIGIPARLAVGFGPGDYNPFTGFYVVRNIDAYALTEVFFPGYGWFMFDPIPGHEILPPSVDDYSTFSVLRQFWTWVAGWLPSPVAAFFNQIFEWTTTMLARALAWVSNLLNRGAVGALIGAAIVVGLGFMGWVLWKGLQFLRYRIWLNQIPPMESVYQQMLRWLESQGYRKSSAQTPLEYAHQLREHQPPQRAALIEEISQAYIQWRYGGRSPNLTQLKRQLNTLKKRQPKQG